MALRVAERGYYSSRGWFSCDAVCQRRKSEVERLSAELRAAEEASFATVRRAKGRMGLFSSFGVEEARDLFWTRFAQGRSFAARQSRWDALFLGISAMGRDENLLSYALRVLAQVLLNFTVGMMGAVVSFIWSLHSLVQTYQASLAAGLSFFLLASLAAVSFGITWLIGMYITAAGAVYVGAKLIASNLRLEGGEAFPRRRMEYRQR